MGFIFAVPWRRHRIWLMWHTIIPWKYGQRLGPEPRVAGMRDVGMVLMPLGLKDSDASCRGVAGMPMCSRWAAGRSWEGAWEAIVLAPPGMDTQAVVRRPSAHAPRSTARMPPFAAGSALRGRGHANGRLAGNCGRPHRLRPHRHPPQRHRRSPCGEWKELEVRRSLGILR